MKLIHKQKVMLYGIEFKHNSVYETTPHWRTIKTNKGKYYLYFPYMQFHFFHYHATDTHNFLNIYSSKDPFPAPSINFPKKLRNSCLGDYQITDHSQAVARFWQTEFNVNNSPNFQTLLTLTNQYKSNIWNISSVLTLNSMDNLATSL